MLASFEGGQITTEDLRNALASKDPVSRSRLDSREGKLKVLKQLEDYQLLILEAKRRGYDKGAGVQTAVRHAAADTLYEELRKPDPASIAQAEVERIFADLKAQKLVPPGATLTEKDAAKTRQRLAAERADAARAESVKHLMDDAHPEVHPELVDNMQRPAFVGVDQPSGFAASPRDPRAPVQSKASDLF